MSPLVLVLISLGVSGAAALAVFLFIKLFRVEDFYKVADQLIKDGNYEKAKQLLTRKSDSFPHDFIIKYYLGLAYEGLRDYAQAIHYFEKASITAAASDQSEIKIQLFLKTAEMYRKTQKLDSALGYYAMVLEKEPQNLKALQQSGEISYEMKSWQKARGFLDNLLKLRPGDIRSRFILGKICVHLRQAPEAIAHFEKILADEKVIADKVMQTNTRLLLADVYVAIKSFQKAVECLTPLLDDKERFDETIVKIIDIYLQFNQIPEALKLIQDNMTRVSPDRQCDLIYYIGNAYFKQERYYEAIKAWAKAYRINPNYKDLARLNHEYSKVIDNPKLESVYTEDENKAELLINKLAMPHKVEKLVKRRRYWAFLGGGFTVVLYRTPVQLSIRELIEIDDLMSHDFHMPNGYQILSLYGVERDENSNFDYKKFILVSGDEFVKLISQKSL